MWIDWSAVLIILSSGIALSSIIWAIGNVMVRFRKLRMIERGGERGGQRGDDQAPSAEASLETRLADLEERLSTQREEIHDVAEETRFVRRLLSDEKEQSG